MKRIIALTLLIILATVGHPPAVQAAAVVSMAIETVPEAISADGVVDLNVTVSVGSGPAEDYISDLSLYLEGGSTPIAQWSLVGTGESARYTVSNLLVPSSQLNRPFPVVLYYKDFDGVEASLHGSFIVLEQAPAGPNEARVTFLRTANAQTTTIGGTVNFTYSVRNDGSVEIKDVVITDELTGQVASLSSLMPGQREEFVVPYRPVRDVVSAPVMTYVNSATMQEASAVIAPLTVSIVNPKLTVALKADRTQVMPGDTVTLSCTVLNEGNILYRDIQISEEQLGMMPGISILEPGISYVYTKKIVPVNSAEYVFTIAARDSSGNETTLKSNKVSIVVEGAATATATAASAAPSETLRLHAKPDIDRMNEPGEVTFTLTVSNLGLTPVHELSLSEISAGVLESMDTLPVGDKLFLHTVRIETDKKFAFIVEGKNADGQRVQASTADITISVSQAGTPPSVSVQTALPSDDASAPESEASAPSVVGQAASQPGGSNTLLLALAVVIGLIVFCVIMLIVLFLHDRSARAYPRRSVEESRSYRLSSYAGDASSPYGVRLESSTRDDEDERTRPLVSRRRQSGQEERTRPVAPRHKR